MSRARSRVAAVAAILSSFTAGVPALAQAPCDSVHVLVAYYSRTGSTAKLAEKARAGAASVAGTVPALKTVGDVTREDLQRADGIVLGSPTYYANMAGPMKSFIDDWGFRYGVYLGDRVGGAFATGGEEGGGKEHTVESLLLAMLNEGMIVVGPVFPKLGYGLFGVAATTGAGAQPEPDEKSLQAAFALGARVASVAGERCGSREGGRHP